MLWFLIFILGLTRASSDEEDDSVRHDQLNVHVVHRSALTGSALLRGAVPLTAHERYALPALRSAIATALGGAVSTDYRLVILSLLRLSRVPSVPTAHHTNICAGFLRNGVEPADAEHHVVDAARVKQCLVDARRAGLANAKPLRAGGERKVHFVAAYQCVLPPGWYLYDGGDVSLTGNRLLFCNVDTREFVVAHRADASSLDALADLLYVDRHHKDFARTELEWRFVRANGAAERLDWLSLPIVGESLDPAALFRHNASLAIELAASLEDWLPDQLVQRVRRLRGMLDAERNLVIYLHCAAGIDRSGELAGAVELSLGASWRAVVTRAHAISQNRELTPSNMHALQWYCLYEKHGAPGRDLDCFDTPQAARAANEDAK